VSWVGRARGEEEEDVVKLEKNSPSSLSLSLSKLSKSQSLGYVAFTDAIR